MAAQPSSARAPAVNFSRVLEDLRTLAKIGAEGRGVSRPAFSPADLEARRWLVGRMQAAGLLAEMDGIANVLGRDARARRTVLVGSHTDSVPNGGWLDGPLGVIYGLEAARAWREAHPDASIGFDVVSFADEEGTVEACAGSRAFFGQWAGSAPGTDTPLARALAAAGLSGTSTLRCEPGRQAAYLEAHIEQGPRLEEGGFDIGVVEGIVGVRRRRVRFTGRADHAGTTPMASRQDAGRALFAFCVAVDRAFREQVPPDAVWNLGVVLLSPGAANVVPRHGEVIVEYRHLQRPVIDLMTSLVEEAAAQGGLPVTVEEVGALEPSAMDAALLGDLRAAAEAKGARALSLASGAGHDAMIASRVMPSAMMFVPSIGGRSHDPAEDTREEDLARGLAVYVEWAFRALERLTA